MKRIVYPGTFDPITRGHIDLVERASKLFDTVVLAVANSEKKQPMFALQERMELCAEALSHFENTIESDPNYRRAYFFMALIYSKASKLGKRWLDALDLRNALVADGQAKKYLELSKSKIV